MWHRREQRVKDDNKLSTVTTGCMMAQPNKRKKKKITTAATGINRKIQGWTFVLQVPVKFQVGDVQWSGMKSLTTKFKMI